MTAGCHHHLGAGWEVHKNQQPTPRDRLNQDSLPVDAQVWTGLKAGQLRRPGPRWALPCGLVPMM
jgi:hypothetical protein